MPPRPGCDCRIWRVYLWTCAASLVSCGVGVIALVSPSWTEGGYGDYEYLTTGLLLFCHHRNSRPDQRLCAPLVFGSHEPWFEAVRLLSLLSWMVEFSVMVMSLLLHFNDDSMGFFLPVALLGCGAAVLGIVGSLVYVIVWSAQEVLVEYDVSISWGYAVYVVWHVITLVLFVLLCVTGREIWHNRFKAKRRH
ncbi:hypothetical protein ACOMHN_063594 [Nucella lapillus]